MHDPIREEAAVWFAKRRDGACTRDEEAAFDAWCRRSDAHARAYTATERAWHQWQRLQSSDHMREITAAAMAATTPHPIKAIRRNWRPLLAAACTVVAIVTVGVAMLPRLLSGPTATYSTNVGEQRTARLSDGTRVILNTQTVLQVRYHRGQREVALQRGEAMFEVVHDAGYPFIVAAGDGSVTDLGTRFVARNDDGTVIVTLLRGRVEVSTQGERKRLMPGDQARYGAGIAGIHVRQVDPTYVTAWLHGRLDFNGPLGQAIAEANRYSDVKLRLGDPRLADMPVGGSFHTGDNADIATALSAVFPVRVARSSAREIVLMPR